MRARAIFTLLGAATAFLAIDARAADDARAVAIVVEGGDANAVNSALASHLSAPNGVSDARAFRASLAAHGVRSLVAGLGGRSRSASFVAHARAAAGDAHVDRAVLVKLRNDKQGKRQAHIWVVDPHSVGALVDADVALEPGTDAGGQADALWLAIADDFPAARPVAPAPAPVEAPAPEVAFDGPPSSEAAPTGADRSLSLAGQGAAQAGRWLFVARAEGGAATRRFAYVDRVTSSLRPYTLSAAPFASLALELYPFARAQVPVFRGLGVVGSYGRAVGLSSADASGTRVGTTWQSYDVGVRQRYAAGPALFGLDVAYGANDLHFDTPSFDATLPSANYTFVRAGLDTRVSVGAFSLLAGGGYLDVLRAGALQDAFPRETVAGVDAFLGGAYSITTHLELSMRLDYTRFFYAFNPQPGDANVAGGALDEMAKLSLGLAYTL
jgi:hypothetical protein